MKEEYRGSKEHAYHISCGGIVFRENNRSLEVLLLHRRKSSDWEYDSWHLPKGTQYKDESEEDAAKREILEETGYEVEVLEKVGSLLSSYQLDGVTINKKTSYFICKALRNVGSGVKEHDEVR